MPRYRPVRPYPLYRNADEGLQRLEAAARAGDPGALEALVNARLRTGTLTVQWLAEAGVDAVRLLPGDLQADLKKAMKLAEHTSPLDMGRNHGGWFPNHELQNVCPRGHRVESGYGFMLIEVAGVTRDVSQATAETLFPVGLPETGDDEDPFVSCQTCWASWPAGEVDYSGGEEEFC